MLQSRLNVKKTRKNTDFTTLDPIFITTLTPPLINIPNGQGIMTLNKNGQLTQIDFPNLQNSRYITKPLSYYTFDKEDASFSNFVQSPDK